MSDNPESNDERPCLHCLIGDLIDEFYAQYGSLSGEANAIDVDEIITALAKTVAEMTFGSDAVERQRVELSARDRRAPGVMSTNSVFPPNRSGGAGGRARPDGGESDGYLGRLAMRRMAVLWISWVNDIPEAPHHG